jgi:hypothetical protein
MGWVEHMAALEWDTRTTGTGLARTPPAHSAAAVLTPLDPIRPDGHVGVLARDMTLERHDRFIHCAPFVLGMADLHSTTHRVASPHFLKEKVGRFER